MKFTLHIATDCECEDIIEECATAVSNVLSAKDKYFAVEWNPHEVQSKGC